MTLISKVSQSRSAALMTYDGYRPFVDALEHHLGQPIGRTPLIDGLADFYDYCMDLAELKAQDLLALVDQHPRAVIEYISCKLATFSEPDGGPDNVVNEPLPLTFPIGHLIEFALFEQDADIGVYLKKLGIPKAKQYQAQIRSLFENLMKRHAVDA